MELNDIIMKLKPGDSISVGKIQREYGLGFVKAKELFDALVEQEYVIKDKNKDRYLYNPDKYKKVLEEQYGNLSALIGSYDGKKILDLPEGMKKEEFIKLIRDNKKGMNIIFLDIDGVLNCRSTKDKCGPYRGIEDDKVVLLKKLVNKYDAKIVLVSSWKEKWFKASYWKDKQDDLANYLDMKMNSAGLIVYDKTESWYSRYIEVNEYLNRLKRRNIVVNNFVIFDDESYKYSRDKSIAAHLIQTSFENGGLMEKHIKKAATILERSLYVRRYHW